MVFSGVLSKMGSIIPNVRRVLFQQVNCAHLNKNVCVQWKARYFILDGDKLTYFASEGGEQKGQYVITADTELEVSDSMVVDFVFVLRNPRRNLYMSASSEEDLDSWMRALETSIQRCRGST